MNSFSYLVNQFISIHMITPYSLGPSQGNKVIFPECTIKMTYL